MTAGRAVVIGWKPKLYVANGEWNCGCVYGGHIVSGVGPSPAQAYNDMISNRARIKRPGGLFDRWGWWHDRRDTDQRQG